MDKKEIILKVKELLNFNSEKETIEVSLMEIKDIDGRIISYDGHELVVGEPVTITLLEDDELSSEYILEDGRTLVIDVNSIIVEIKDAPVEEEVVEEEVVVEEEMAEVEVEPLQDAVVGADEKPVESIVEDIQDEINETEDQNDEAVIMGKRMDNLEDLVRKMIEKQNKLVDVNIEMAKVIEVYGNETTSEDIKLSKQLSQTEIKKNNLDNSLEAIKNIRK